MAIDIIKGVGSDYECCYVSPAGEIAQQLDRAGIKHIPLKSIHDPGMWPLLRKIAPALIHAHDYRASIAAGCFGRAPVISHIHHNSPAAARISVKTVAYVLAAARLRKIVAVSSAVAEEALGCRLLKAKVAVIPNAVGPRVVTLARQGAAVPSDLLFAGRLAEPKQPLAFIAAVSRLAAVFPGIKGVMIGDGPLKERCLALIAERGLEGNVRLAGFQANPYPFMAGTKMLVMPSKWEGFGLAAVEAMLLGAPVIALRVGGLKDIVVDRETGYLCDDPGDIPAYAAHLLNNPTLRERMGLAARKRALAEYRMDVFIERIAKLYSLCLRD